MNKHSEGAIKLAREKGLKPGDKIPIATYPDEESFSVLRNPDGLAFSEHKSIVAEMISALSAAGYIAMPVKISIDEYSKWLGDDLNTPQKRAEFVARKMRDMEKS